jgi:O-antigen/teichoic acid export membrane protein
MLKFTEYIKKLTKDPAVSGTLVVSVGSLLAGFFNYLLQFFLGRTLSISDFGVFNALLSLSVILTVLSGSLSAALIKSVADLQAEDRTDVLTKLFKRLSFAFMLLGIGIFGLIYLFKSYIMSFFFVGSLSYILGFAFYMSISFVGILAPSFLQGLLRFKSFAIWTSLSSLIRLLIPVVFVILGLKVGGVFVGVGLSILLAYVLSMPMLKKNFSLFEQISLKGYYKKLIVFAGPVVFVQLGMTLLNNVDVILVKHFFAAETAGLYSGVVTLGKLFLFGAGTVCVVMYPQIASSFAKKEDVFRKVEPFLLIQLAVLVCGFLVFSFLPELVTRFMFGDKYLASVEYLPRFAIFVGFYVITNFFTLFFLAINKTKIFILHISAAILQLVLINYFHGSIRSVIDMNIIVSALLASTLLGYFLYLLMKNPRLSGRIR